MSKVLKISFDQIKYIGIDRAHRLGPPKQGNSVTRSIVCKFTLFKDREFIRKQSKNLKGSIYYINEQFPPEIIEKRKKLIPQMKAAHKRNKKAWISYDTLYIDGVPVRDN